MLKEEKVNPSERLHRWLAQTNRKDLIKKENSEMNQQKSRTTWIVGIVALIGLAAAVVALIWRIKS